MAPPHLAAHPGRFRTEDLERVEHVHARGDEPPLERPTVGDPLLLDARSGQLATARRIRVKDSRGRDL